MARRKKNDSRPKKLMTPEAKAALLERLNAGRIAKGLTPLIARSNADSVAGSNDPPAPTEPLEAAVPPRSADPAPAKARKKPGRGKSIPSPQPDEPAKGSKGATTQAKAVAEMAQQLKGMHEFAAMMTGLNSLVITDKQAQTLAEPAYLVSRKYGLLIDKFLGPEIALLLTAAYVYVPMLRLLKEEVEQKRRAEAATPPASTTANPDGSMTVIYPDAFRAPQQPNPAAPPMTFDQPAEGGGLAGGE
jgi:hypothetical protein